MNDGSGASAPPTDFVRDIVAEDLKSGKHARIVTRFPPEPNGYLHIGHAKSICLNFGIARETGGVCHLRFDDTNPAKEDLEYVESIQEDVRWLGFDWGDKLFFASDYYERLWEFAAELIRKGKAFVCDLSLDEIAARRGTPREPGRESPYRNRSAAENLDLFARMKAGEFQDGARVLRAKIDMGHPNFHMRDPVLYRIRKQAHHRTGERWVVYPMYDFAHPLSDAIEGITHSICTLEFEDHRPLYDWLLDNLDVPSRPRQHEFARLNLSYTLMSKRKLLELVESKLVSGWDDPRMPTLRGLRRRGFTPESIRAFCRKIGVTKFNSLTELELLEHCLRDDLNKRARRVLGVLDPLKVVLTNYPEGQVEELDAVNNPEDPAMGSRKVPFSRELYIERSDFMEDPPKKFHRLFPGGEVRLRYAYFITCERAVKDPATGALLELHCRYDPATRGGDSPDGRKVRGTIHWVAAQRAFAAELRLYDRLLTAPEPDPEAEDSAFKSLLNPDSLRVLAGCLLEPSLRDAQPGELFQFERQGYFCVDSSDSRPGRPVFNRAVPLRDSWAKAARKF